MRFLSVCSGIEAASVAWNPLGWKAVAFSEIDSFPSAVLAHHYPDTPNLGDMTKFKDWPDANVDLLCGGTPCQSFSSAGLRAGLDDPRGQLMLTFGAIAARYRPRWLVWENVPGVLSSNGGRDFGAFLGLLGVLGYGFAYRVLDAQFVRVDGYGRAVPQRRQRVFVVGCLGDWRSAAAVLLERESLRGDPAPRREAGKVAPTIPSRRSAGGGFGTDFDCDGGLVSIQGNLIGRDNGGPVGVGVGVGGEMFTLTKSDVHAVSMCLNAKGGGGRLDAESETLIPTTGGGFDVAHTLRAQSQSSHRADSETFVAHTLRGDGFDASEDGTGRGTPLVPVGVDYTNGLIQGDISGTLDAAHSKGNRGQGVIAPIAFGWQNAAAQGMPVDTIAPTLDKSKHPATATATAVRRLMPIECERLQGFPDNYTLVPYRGKLAKDGPRYKAIGNSWAVNCARWIGWRISVVDSIRRESARQAA